MSKFLFSTLLILSSLSLFAYDNVIINRVDFGKAQDFSARADRYNNNGGEVKITVKKVSASYVNGAVVGTIEYTLTNNLMSDIERIELEFDLMNGGQELADFEVNYGVHGRLAKGETKSYTFNFSDRQRYEPSSTDIDSVKVEIDAKYVDSRQDVKF